MTGPQIADLVLGIIAGIAAVTAYWVPAIVAKRRHVPNFGSVFVVNLFAGWSVIGWVIALAMAVRSVPPVAAAERNAG